MSHSAEKLRRGKCSRKILVSKNVRDKRGGEYHNFPSKFFCLTVPKNFVGEPFSVSLISGIENFYALEGYDTIFDFLSKFFCLTVLKNFVGESFSVSLISGIEKYWIRGGRKYRDFPSKVFCLTVPKNFVEEPFSVSLISGIDNFYASEGYATIFDFLSKFFCLTVPKNFVGELFCAVFQKIYGREKVYG